MEPIFFVTTDFGFGDACKGSSVHYLTHLLRAGTVVRTGGCQALHNVITSEGIHHTHVQFGSGTFAGAGTYLSKHMVIEPYGLFDEGNSLQKMLGSWVYEKLAVDKDCLVATPWHRICNRLRELSRGDARHGSVGVGIGETVSDSLISPDLALHVSDFGKSYLIEKLSHIRQYKMEQIREFADKFDANSEMAKKEFGYLNDETLIAKIAATYVNLYNEVNIVDESYLDKIVNEGKPIIFEPSQGVLLDQDMGFYPYNTFVNTTSSDALELIRSHGYQDQVVRVGLIRAYQHRHGAGPFVTEDDTLTSLLPDQHNEFHTWQRGWRVGHLDLVALQYAIDVCGGVNNFNGLGVSCLDRVRNKNLPLGLCYNYQFQGETTNLEDYFFLKNGLISGIKVYRGNDSLAHQERLTQLLADCRPIITNVADLASNNIGAYLKLIEDQLQLNVLVESFGSTETDKILTKKGKQILLRTGLSS